VTQRQFGVGRPPAPRASASTRAAFQEHMLVALQRQAGNRAVASRLNEPMTAVQRCGGRGCAGCGSGQDEESLPQNGNASVQRVSEVVVQRDPPTDTPRVQARIPQHLGPLMAQWRAAGLLDPPFRPPDVADFPAFGMPVEAQAVPAAPPAAGMLAPGLVPESPPVRPPIPMPPPARPVPPPVPRPVPAPAPAPVPGTSPAPSVEPPLLSPLGAGVLVFIAIMLYSSPTAPPWMDTLSPITGGPYGGPDEYQWTQRLSEPQREYLRHLMRARRIQPDAAADGDVSPDVLPQPQPRPRRRVPGCFAADVPRRGGHARHDAYATKVTGSPFDHFVRTPPPPVAINYDGRQQSTRNMWEVKTGFGWFFNPDLSGPTAATLARWDTQKNLGLTVAGRCVLTHLWAHHDRHVVQLLIARWGGVPTVLHIPE
jgi:hypothetical protein